MTVPNSRKSAQRNPVMMKIIQMKLCANLLLIEKGILEGESLISSEKLKAVFNTYDPVSLILAL